MGCRARNMRHLWIAWHWEIQKVTMRHCIPSSAAGTLALFRTIYQNRASTISMLRSTDERQLKQTNSFYVICGAAKPVKYRIKKVMENGSNAKPSHMVSGLS